MFAIQFARAAQFRAGVDREDAHWHQCLTKYVSLQEAEQDLEWMAQEDPAFEYRVVPLFDSVPPANDNGEPL